MGKTYGLENYITALDAEGNVRTVAFHNWKGEACTVGVEIGSADYRYVIDYTAQDILPLGGILVDSTQKLVVPISEFKPEIQKNILGRVIKDGGFVHLASLGQIIIDLTNRIKEAAKPS